MKPGSRKRGGAKKPFWDELEVRLRAAGLNKSLFARQLGITPQGLSSWKERGQFRRQALPKAAQTLGWPELADEGFVEGRFDVELINARSLTQPSSTGDRFTAALRNINKSYRIYEKYFRQYAAKTLPIRMALS